MSPVNFLAHLVLSGPDPHLRLGGLMADFTRPDVEGHLPEGVRRGIRLHRVVDRFTDSHPVVLAARRRCAPAYRLASGILADLIFDHLLARDWHVAGVARPLETFASEVYAELRDFEDLMPPRMQLAARRMAEEDWLTHYRDPAFFSRIVDRTARRLRRPELLVGGGTELERHPIAWERDFHTLWPDLQALVEREESL